MNLRFEPLSGQHDRSGFACGNATLDDWFRQYAGQDQRRSIARVFVAIDQSESLVGFYSLSAFGVAPRDFPAEQSRRLPRYDVVPAALIGRLARHESVRGQGVGDLLLADAVTRILQFSENVGVNAIIVDAIDDTAVAFYRSAGFLPFPDEPARLFLPLATARSARP